MPSLVYAPGIKVYIDTIKHGILDVSDDITNFQMTRREDGVSQFSFSLQNARRKYDNVFTPNDRIVVMMKRIVWMRTFTGYLNNVPLLTAWPRVVPLTASCSLKRLQYFYWDSTLAASEELIRTSLLGTPDYAGEIPDGGIKSAILNILDTVVGWNGPRGAAAEGGGKVHIGGIPDNWYEFAVEIAKAVTASVREQQALVMAMRQELGGGASLYGVDGQGIGDIPAGRYGNTDWSEVQTRNAAIIIATGLLMGATDKDCIVAIMTAMQECTLVNLASRRVPGSENHPQAEGVAPGDYDSVGLFQQRNFAPWIDGPDGSDNQGHQRMDKKHSTTKFFTQLLKLSESFRATKPPTVVAQTIQRSAYPNHYAKWEKAATEMYAKAKENFSVAVPGNNPAIANGGLGGQLTTNPTPGRRPSATGRGILETGIGLVQANPNIPYTQRYTGTHMNILSSPPSQVPGLDCSSFMQWVYYNTLGGLNGIPRTAALQAQWCKSAGGRQISVYDGMRTAGAVLFATNNGTMQGIYHCELSLGNGKQVVGAHRTGTNASVINYPERAFSYAFLLPGLSYTGAEAQDGSTPAPYDPNSNDPRVNGDLPPHRSGTPGSFGGTAGAAGSATDVSTVAEGDAIGQLFGDLPWQDLSASGEGLGNQLLGAVALSNDEPILPYLITLCNSTLRKCSSGPNGDFIAWFPDYYGLWGTAAIMQLEPIEIMDFSVDWTDEGFVTHQFVSAAAPGTSGIDINTGQITQNDGFLPIQQSAGIVSIDIPAVMRALFGLDQTPEDTLAFTKFIYDRFGPRPNHVSVPGITGPRGEFFYALFLFMRQWAYQYNANIDLTFMPELWPGMLIQVPHFNFQAYITQVTHTGAYGAGGRFTTQINISSPARLSAADSRLEGLPLAGKYEAGRQTRDPLTDRAANRRISNGKGSGGLVE